MTQSAATKNAIDLLGQIPLFGEMDASQLERIADQTRQLALRRGEILFQKGDPSNGFYFVLSGQIKLALLSEMGDEKVVEIIAAGMSFGEAVMLIDLPYPAYAEALQATELIFIAKEAVFQGIEESTAFSRKLLAGMSRRLHGMIKEMEDITLHSSSQRIIGYLLREDLLEKDAQNNYQLVLPTSKSLIASRLNLTPETFSRILHNLQGEGLIRVSGRTIQIADLDALSQFGQRG